MLGSNFLIASPLYSATGNLPKKTAARSCKSVYKSDIANTIIKIIQYEMCCGEGIIHGVHNNTSWASLHPTTAIQSCTGIYVHTIR